MATHPDAGLSGSPHYYDTLSDHEQAVVRAEWATQITKLREGLDLAAIFEAEGRPYVVLGDDGNPVIHNGDGFDTPGS